MLTKLLQLLTTPAVLRDKWNALTWTPREKLREFPSMWKASGGNLWVYWKGDFPGSKRYKGDQ